jgi:hypothetical protein
MPAFDGLDFRFPGLAHRAPGFGQLLSDHFGFSPFMDNDDWVISATDPRVIAGPRDVLKIHQPISLEDGNRHKVSGRLLKCIPTHLDHYFDQHGQRISVSFDEDSRLNHVHTFAIRLASAPNADVRTIVRDELLPFMIDKMHATAVCPISLDLNYQQGVYTLAKFGLLLQRYESRSDVESMAFDKHILKGILPNALNTLWYASSLTMLAPFALSLPMERAGCAWHFIANGPFSMKAVHCEGLFQQFCNNLSPVSEQTHILGPREFPRLASDDARRYLEVVVLAINNLYRFLNNLRNFQDYNGEIQFAKQIQSFGAIHLLFADVANLNYSTTSFHRINCAMSILDKLANILKYLGKQSGSESDIFKRLVSMERCKLAREIVRQRAGEIGGGIAEKLCEMVQGSYGRMHRHYKEEIDANMAENDIVDRIYQQRNLRHGTFLRGKQFSSLFGNSKGTFAEEIVGVAFSLPLVLALDPKRFLGLA